MDRVHLAEDKRVLRVVLLVTASASLVAMGLDLGLSAFAIDSVVRSMAYLSVMGLALIQYRSGSDAQIVPVFVAGVFAAVSLNDLVFDVEFSLLDPPTTVALLILTSIAYLSIRKDESRRPVIALVLGIAAYSVVAAILGDFSTTTRTGLLFIGVVGQTLVLWIVYQLITTLANASAADAKHARIQRALAECSQALLNRTTDQPLKTALRSLLDATDGHYAYIDINRTDEAGNITWEIVAEAIGDDYPDGDPTFTSGSYDQMSVALERLRKGEPVAVRTSELAMPIRARYEKEGIKAELVAPIFIGERWVGSLGYTDHIREGSWSQIEIDGLMRAAEMVGAYWERETAREGLMELAQAKDRFIAAVSHELRTPLAAVVGFAGELASGVNGYSPEEASEIASMIYTQSLELTHLVDDLLTSERAASGNLTIKPRELALLDECRDIVGSVAVEGTVSVEGEPTTAWADSLRARQIIRNLLTNASRYGGSTIVVEVGSSQGAATVTVKDDGAGVRHIDVDRIFDHYYRSQGHGSVPDSVGLGLSVARQLARLMGGDIAYRRRGGWTHFELSLPLSAPTEAVTPEMPELGWEAPDGLTTQSSNGGAPIASTLNSQASRS